MLTRPNSRTCIECGLSFGHANFAYHAGKIENGPSYWSDRGLLCSVACSTVHFEKRERAGDAMKEPAPDPFERD
ncbi:hypothetical protein [Microvirga guangxiensis]|uniref:C2H2-type domain-containing protein n=1 Tax=Microvirga guangxiensis TaxID=549386 RepID=A0A1G5ISG9_9HYPH|nr:hypothetical protein [Microvirga guangxiensis]SCY78368.1 hypothetical protein SAMN02927923_02260 [Microvirga guangxiensis]